MEEIKKTKMICSKCNYEWETKSKKMYVVCPNCLRKNKVNGND